MLLHDEPIYLDNSIVGRTTSGNYSFNFNKNLAFGYVKEDLSKVDLAKKNLFIEVSKIKYPADLLLSPLNNNNFKTI